jgi:hypothetical protein
MKKSKIVTIISTTCVIVLFIWIWHLGVKRRQNADSQSGIIEEISTLPRVAKPILPVEPKKEKRFSIIFRPSMKCDDVGSITYLNGDVQSTERPGDEIIIQMEIMGLKTYPSAMGQIASGINFTGEGSEIRFAAEYISEINIIKAESYQRLSFRKIDGDWAYVSGLGQYEEQGKVTRLGHNRTVESCLELLKNEDPILREGGARDLGRLCTPKDAPIVVPCLIDMLKDSSNFVRRGAIEGLGLIGTAIACQFLQDCYGKEQDKLTKEYLEEALSFCAAFSLLGEKDSIAVPPETGLERIIGKNEKKLKSDCKWKINAWIADNIQRRVNPHLQESLSAIDKNIESTNKKVAQAAVLIREAIQSQKKSESGEQNYKYCASFIGGMPRTEKEVR